MLTYLSVCSGIEAASVAWQPLGWKALAFSEIEAFPSAVLAHHYPDVPNFGDMTRFQEWPDLEPDVLVGGTPCQSFSVAGLRAGLDDPRGELMLVYGAIARRHRPQWLVWENVPGVLSSNGGRDFGTFLGMLAELGYGFAYRVLDAQFFGVAQQRRRVFVVGHLGDWRRAAAVLFERESLSGNPAPRREAGEGVAHSVTTRVGNSSRPAGGNGNLIAAPHADLSPALKARDSKGPSSDGDGAILVPMVAHSLRSEGFDASEDGTGRGTPLVPVATDVFNGNITGDVAATMGTRGSSQGASGPTVMVPVAFNWQSGGDCRGLEPQEITNALHCGQTPAAMYGAAVRRLTPRECARLQGFPDDYLDIAYRGRPAADGPKYRALGNSMAVPCMAWLGRRIQMVEDLCSTSAKAAG